MLANLVEVKPLRGLFQQYLDRVGQQLDGPGNHHQCDDRAGHGIETIPAGGNHDQRRSYYSHGAECVVHHFEECGLHIHIVFALRGENKD